MVDYVPAGGPSTGATMTTFRVASDSGASDGGLAAPKSRMGGAAMPSVMGALPNGLATIPLSARRAQALDLATVERRGHGAPNNPPPKPNRMFGLQESLTYRPTAEQFKDPVQYIASIREEAQKYGIVKIIPPDTWNPDFAIDTEVRDHACDFYSPFAMHILSFSSLADTLTALPLSHTQARAELG
jgi:histone demethylase JARID1